MRDAEWVAEIEEALRQASLNDRVAETTLARVKSAIRGEGA